MTLNLRNLLNPKTFLRCLTLGVAWFFLIPMMLAPVTWIERPWLGRGLYWLSYVGVHLANLAERLR